MADGSIGDGTSNALTRLAVDLFTTNAIPYELAEKVYSRVLETIGEAYGPEARRKVESDFILQASFALKALRIENSGGLRCPHCRKGFPNMVGVTVPEDT